MSLPETEPYSVWEASLEALAGSRGPVMILGGTDAGKTTFTRLLINRMTSAGRAAALLDTDPGQSEIGPPGCVGLAFIDTPVTTLSDLPPKALAFVGNSTPSAHLLEHASAASRLAAMAGERALIVDTCGYIQGGGARRLHQIEADLLRPAHIVALQRRGEIESILAPMRRRSGCTVHTPGIPDAIQRKSTALRTQRRAMRFASYFEGSTLHTFAFTEIALAGTWLGGGVPLPPHLLKFLNQAVGYYTRIYHAEMCGGALGLMVGQPFPMDSPGMDMVHEQLKPASVAVTAAPRLRNLLLGLESAEGSLLGLGLLEALDFKRRTLGVRTPVRSPAAAAILRFGTLRLTADGREIGSLRPGEL